MALNLFIVGPSGSGKSTQAKLIAQKYKLTHISMGQVFRHEINQKTKLGLTCQKFINHGRWVPNRITLPLLESQLKAIDYQNFIIDGFPRKVSQARLTKSLLARRHQTITAFFHLSVTLKEIMARRQKSGPQFQAKDRTDNTPSAISTRHRSYINSIKPILKYFSQQRLLFTIDGNRPVKPIFSHICKEINNLIHSNQ